MTTTMMSVEGDFRAMAEAGVDGALRRNLPTFRSETARLLRKMQRQMDSPPVHRDLPCIFSELRRAEALEDNSADLINSMAAVRDYCRHGAAHFAAKEPALAEALRGKAAWSDATRAEFVEIAAGARALRGVCLKMLAEAEEGHIVCMATADYLAYVAEDTPYEEWGPDSIPAFMYQAVVDQLGAADPDVTRFMEVFAQERAGSLTRGAAEFGGDDAVKLREHAATVEALCADADTFLHKIVSSPYFQRARLFSILREAAGGP
jgi:hypothetical protein